MWMKDAAFWSTQKTGALARLEPKGVCHTSAQHVRRKCGARGVRTVTLLTRALVSSVTVSALHLRTLPQGPRVSSKTVSSHLPPHRVTPIRTLRTHCTLVVEQVTAHLVDSRVTACTRRTVEEASLPATGSDRKRRDLLATG